MLTTNPPSNHLPNDFRIYLGPQGEVSDVPRDGFAEKHLPTVNIYTGTDGGYIECYSRNPVCGLHLTDKDVYFVGNIRLQGCYRNRLFEPKGFEGQDLAASQALKDICNAAFPTCGGDCWASGAAVPWFGLRADGHDDADRIHVIEIPASLPAAVDLRQWCSPPTNQATINACTAHAAVALVDFFERRSAGVFVGPSPLFLYKVTRNLAQETGDTGSNTRSTMKALANIGVAPEQYWPYDIAKFDDEPSAFCYALASRSSSTEYFRLDPRDRPKELVLHYVKATLAAERPVMFGVMAYVDCWKQFAMTGSLPFPAASDIRFGGHNMAIMGYDDSRKIMNAIDEVESTGAFLVKNSYGEAFGDKGFGWVSFDYLIKHQSIDWWTITKQEWLKTEGF